MQPSTANPATCLLQPANQNLIVVAIMRTKFYFTPSSGKYKTYDVTGFLRANSANRAPIRTEPVSIVFVRSHQSVFRF